MRVASFFLCLLTLLVSAAAADPFWKWFCQYTYSGVEQFKRSVSNSTTMANETEPPTTIKFHYRNSPTTAATLSTSTVSSNTVSLPKTQPVAKEQCAQYEDSQLYGMLQDVRAFNQRFMANTVRDAAKFPELHVTDLTGGERTAGFTAQRVTTKLKQLSDCDENCQLVEKQLNAALEEYKSTRDATINPLGNGGRRLKIVEGVGISDAPTTNQFCKLEAFFAIGDCAKRGEEVHTGYSRLCTACNGVYKVSTGCFPQFFNAVTCDNNDTTCIYDWWRLNAHGKCQEQKLTFTVMKNLGTPTCQRWEYENLQVPIGCECMLNKSSFLRT